MRIALAIVLVLVFAAPARAQDDENQANLARAAAYWGASPNCPNGVHVTYNQALVTDGAFAAGGGCGIWTGDKFETESPGARCQTITHEWGHLLGYGEDHAWHPGLPADPVGVMTSYAQPPACAALEPVAPTATLTVAAPPAAPVNEEAVGWQARRALAIAQTVWHPTCGRLTLRFANPASVRGLVPEESAGWASAGNCVITLSDRRRWEFETLCQSVLHEAGHVAGVGHIDDRPSVMNSSTIVDRAQTTIHGRKIVTWTGIDRRCLNRGRPYLLRHGLL